MDAIQLIGSIVAIFIIALITAVVFRSRPSRLDDERIQRAVIRTLPDMTFGTSAPTARYKAILDTKAAVCLVEVTQNDEQNQNPSYLVVIAMGDRTVARSIAFSALPSAETISTESGYISLNFGDFTAPSKKLYYDGTNRDALIGLLEKATNMNKGQTNGS